ncbi:uncharacterized protein PFL1_01745 [Pseudozyma flocculosa PF-1]|uniref:Uncharacterized protein n=1 Tax=Pseudozyma flocculosa TaxID=84751 RepID=A0A5C3F0J0_9BASI|nr:uncharacterized protein PFL1_01745 [Pseudozyma flocculosa PF-1]EPQ30847.1 hypothetical protein PFL1_01745 [Pseudozyma flocculosa PF-1]SPO36781.1 uncharacterized protein PSFLO_02252 [Pseudozyma flocculosa]
MLPPSPPRRNLRARKAQQLNPYTLEAIRYQRTLVRNNWEDAVVSQREWARQEKKRLSEEAARAAAEAGESQSQWLEPDPEDEAQEESWAREEEREKKRRAQSATGRRRDSPRAGDRGQVAEAASRGDAQTGAAPSTSRSKIAGPTTSAERAKATWGPSTRLRLSSDSETEAEETIAPPARSSGSKDGPPRAGKAAAPATRTYAGRGAGKAKVGPTIAPVADTPQQARARSRSGSSSGSSSPVLAPRKHRRLRSLSKPIDLVSSDTDPGPPGVDSTQAPPSAATPAEERVPGSGSVAAVHYLDSSADEDMPAGPTASSKARSRRGRRRANEGVASDSDSTDYERRFRQLKKMMPAGMARKHIEDLRAMRHGKAYHSDGHISSTPTASEQSQEEDGDATVPAARSTPSTSPLDAAELRPGQARKRMRHHSPGEGDRDRRFELFPADSESESGQASASSQDGSACSDSDSEVEMLRLWADRRRPKQAREADAIDRMLSRTDGGGKRQKKARRGVTQARRSPKQHRLDAFVSGNLEAAGPGDVLAPGSHGGQRPTSDAKAVSTSGLKRKRRKADPRVGRTRSTHRGPAARPANPAVVKPRTRPRLDLVNDDVLFDFQVSPGLDDDSEDGFFSMLGPSPAAARSSPQRAPAIQRDEGAADGAVAPQQRRAREVGISPEGKAPQRTALESPHVARGRVSNNALAHSPSPLRHLDDPSQSPVPVPRPGYLQARVMPQTKSPGSDARSAGANGASSPSSRPAAAADKLDAQRIEADAWDDHEGLRLDFGIRPPPVGLSFADETFLGRGRLHELLHLPEYLDAAESALPPNWTRLGVRIGGIELTAMMSAEEVLASLPALFEALSEEGELARREGGDAPDEPSGDAARRRGGLEEASRFICLKLTAEALQPELGPQVFRFYRAIIHQVDLLLQRLRKRADAPLEPLLRLLWFRVELCWRMLAACGQDQAALALDGHEVPTFQELANSSKLLMLLLLRHGLNRTMRAVKTIADALVSDPGVDDGGAPRPAAVTKLADTSAEMWVCLIHLLDRAGKEDMGGVPLSFWSVFEAALTQWQGLDPRRSSIIAAESTWYCIFGISALSHVSPSTGTAHSIGHLGEHWPVVARALAAVRLRFDAAVESSMSLSALNKRDRYVRVVLHRCLDLSAAWGWKMEGADLALSRLFDIFDSHRLTDLPSESDHDFPRFLRDFDELALYQPAERDDSCFHVFVKLVARASRDLRASARDQRDGDRKVSRLFSRISPVRTMAFTRDDVPTSGQRSMLFNHYAVVMLFLFVAPSQAAQRLRQIKSFLPFRQADFASQVACVRAMMYAAAIFRHHRLDVSPISAWFGEVATLMMKEYEALEKTTGTQSRRPPGAAPLAPMFQEARARQVAVRRQSEVARLIVAVLRSLQHVIEHPTLSRHDDVELAQPVYPDLKLLHTSWTKDILEAQLAIDPVIGHEALKCIQSFLLQRNRAVASRASTGKHAPATSNESQDSFADLFDDAGFDFDDPTLDNLLGAQPAGDGPTVEAAAPPPSPSTSIKAMDREFADYAIDVISPALFRLVSNIYHPDRRAEGLVISLGVTERLTAVAEGGRSDRRNRLDRIVKDAERRRYLEAVVDCWAGCAHVLIQNGLRSWTSYLTYGNESWKRIDDPVGKRDVGLRFLLNVLVLDPAAFGEHEAEFMAMWCHSAVARVLSVQHNFTVALCKVASGSVLCRGWKDKLLDGSASSAAASVHPTSLSDDADAGEPALRLQDFQAIRADLVATTLANISADAERTDAEAARRRPMLFACLSALLSALRLYLEDTPGEAKERQAYLDFCRGVVREVQARIGGTLLRGVGSEVSLTVAALERQQSATVPIVPQ